ncbi:unnamed protein product [Leuciscus chuanchicus]
MEKSLQHKAVDENPLIGGTPQACPSKTSIKQCVHCQPLAVSAATPSKPNRIGLTTAVMRRENGVLQNVQRVCKALRLRRTGQYCRMTVWLDLRINLRLDQSRDQGDLE